jgi:hypothetical protein
MIQQRAIGRGTPRTDNKAADERTVRAPNALILGTQWVIFKSQTLAHRLAAAADLAARLLPNLLLMRSAGIYLSIWARRRGDVASK